MPWGPAPKSSRVRGGQNRSSFRALGKFPRDSDRLHELEDKLPWRNSGFLVLSWAWASICPVLPLVFPLGKKGGKRRVPTQSNTLDLPQVLVSFSSSHLIYWINGFFNKWEGKFLGTEGQENPFSELCVRFPGVWLGLNYWAVRSSGPSQALLPSTSTRGTETPNRTDPVQDITPVHAPTLTPQTAKPYFKKKNSLSLG